MFKWKHNKWKHNESTVFCEIENFIESNNSSVIKSVEI